MSRAALLSMLTLSPSLALADGPGEYGHHLYGPGWTGAVMGPLMLLVFLALAAALCLVLLRWTGVLQSSPRSRSLQILEERFARGEIDAEELAERRRLLDV